MSQTFVQRKGPRHSQNAAVAHQLVEDQGMGAVSEGPRPPLVARFWHRICPQNFEGLRVSSMIGDAYGYGDAAQISPSQRRGARFEH